MDDEEVDGRGFAGGVAGGRGSMAGGGEDDDDG
jgi:hypothetical protein